MRRKWTPTKTFELRDYSPVLLGVARVDLIFSWSGLSLSCKSERVQRRAESKEKPAPYPAKSFVLSKRHETRDSRAWRGGEEQDYSRRGVELRWDEMEEQSSTLVAPNGLVRMVVVVVSPLPTLSESFVFPRDNTSQVTGRKEDLECDSSWKAEFMWKSGKLENYSSEFYQTRNSRNSFGLAVCRLLNCNYA